MKVGLVIDPVGKEVEIENLLESIHQRDIRATVTFPGFTTKGPITTEASLKKFLLNGHEIVNHTDSHPGRLMNLNRSMQEQEIQIQHRRLLELGVEILVSTAVQGFDGEQVALESVFTGRVVRHGSPAGTLEASALVSVTSREPEDRLYRALLAEGAQLKESGIHEVTAIGDCRAPALIAQAVYAGHRAAREMDAEPGAMIAKRERTLVQ